MAESKKKTTKKSTSAKKSSQKSTKDYSVKSHVVKETVKVAKKSPAIAILLIIVLVAAALLWFFVFNKKDESPSEDFILATELDNEIDFHFMKFENEFAGDAIYIKAGDNDILIDAGSIGGNVPRISQYMNNYITDNTLEYVIVTHADKDHIAGFSVADNIFSRYVCETIIDFDLSDKTDTPTSNLGKYKKNRDLEVSAGAVHYTASQCVAETGGAKKVYDLAPNITMEILDNYYYTHSSDENDYSVCVLFKHGDRSFLFTGDLTHEGTEVNGEKYLVDHNDIGEVYLYKAGHHGSKTSSSEAMLSVIKPKICVVSCAAGTDEYTDNVPNQFPTQFFIDNISKYTNMVYVTTLGDPDFTGGADYVDMNGDVVVKSERDRVSVYCSNNNTRLKDTEWFKADRTCPSYWK